MSAAIVPPPVGRYSLRSVPTPLLVRQLDALAAQELATDADVLAHLAELEVREENLRLGHASMQDYCMRRRPQRGAYKHNPNLRPHPPFDGRQCQVGAAHEDGVGADRWHPVGQLLQ